MLSCLPKCMLSCLPCSWCLSVHSVSYLTFINIFRSVLKIIIDLFVCSHVYHNGPRHGICFHQNWFIWITCTVSSDFVFALTDARNKKYWPSNFYHNLLLHRSRLILCFSFVAIYPDIIPFSLLTEIRSIKT